MPNITPVDAVLPARLPIIALHLKPIFPSIFVPILLNTEEDLKAIQLAHENGGYLGFVLVKDNEAPVTYDNLYSIGTVAKVVKEVKLPDSAGAVNVFINAIKRFSLKKCLNKDLPLQIAAEYLDDLYEPDNLEIKAMTRSLISELKSISDSNPFFNEEMRLNMINVDQPGKIADFVSSMLNTEREKQQDILETLDIKTRLTKTLMLIKKEQEVQKIQKKVSRQLNERVAKSQREYFLREELKSIKIELGEDDAKGSDYKKFAAAIEKLKLSGEIKEQVLNELEKLATIDPQSSEYGVVRNYLETVVALPWQAEDYKEIDLAKAQKILDRDHYGLIDVKERIMEFLAVRKLKKDAKGSIICLVGPPGVGKTSIGKSIAEALGKPFFRFSVGGMRDEAEIKGHRRTYVGAMPGKILQGLKIAKSKAAVFMLDEVDKMGTSYHGDPASALLEVLDPEQNHSFRDNYLDLPFDLSDTLFILTANTLDTIPIPLLDRMEVIRLAGYTEDEKVEIAKRYIVPKSLKKNGLDKANIKYDRPALKEIAGGYARESGMRNYEKLINRINRKVAAQLALATAEKPFEPVKIEVANLEKYLKQAPFNNDESRKITRPGTVIGLAWTNFGGDTLMIESVAIPGKAGLELTGQMGEVMKESAHLAYSYARLAAPKLDARKDFFDKHTIHLHIPAGATPKDGPSAGITMASALISLASGRKVAKGFAMTGELSLVGNVLPIGGLKEKTLAARRIKIKDIIIPKANERDLSEIDDTIKEGITFHPVSHYDEVAKLLFS
ncbi:MAG: endopeptidase La [Spirochaetaceae bacterium]|nr:endopeptidase La [Spirochaetaceae bacterium]